MTLASYLHRLGFKAHYPGLSGHPGKEIHDRLAIEPGAVLSFTTGSKDCSERIVGATRLWGTSVGFDAVKSLISLPCATSCTPRRSLIRFVAYLVLLVGTPRSTLRRALRGVCQRTSFDYASALWMHRTWWRILRAR